MRTGLLSLVAVLGLSTAASADLKLVQTTTTNGELGQRMQKAAGPQGMTVTMYYKGNKSRVEAGERVTIFDGQRTLLLNAKAKTYQVLPKDLATSAANPMMAMMDIKADVSVKPTGKTQTIQGKKASQYVMNMTMQLGMKPGAMKAMQAQAGSGADKGASPKEMPKIPPITSKIELWTVEFAGITPSSSAMSRQGIGAGMANMPFMKDMTEKMKSIKGIPLLTTTSQDVMGRHMETTMKTTALSEAPLPESLFAAPAGFKQVPYEAPSMMMGMPGAKGGR